MSYSLTVICIQEFANLFRYKLAKISYSYHLPIEDCELIYDWLVKEAFKRLLSRKCRIQDHYIHDVYRCIYDEWGHEIEYLLKQKFRAHHITFNQNERLKILVAGDNIILARGSINS